MGGDPWRLVSKWNLIEDYPDVSFAAFTSNENREKTFENLHMFQEYYHRGGLQDYSAIKEHKVKYWINQVDRCELDLVNPKLKYWTKKGRVTRLKISLSKGLEVREES